jgi:hypothetical protein
MNGDLTPRGDGAAEDLLAPGDVVTKNKEGRPCTVAAEFFNDGVCPL